jgi:cytochrome oxidase assembly protein ShyY1
MKELLSCPNGKLSLRKVLAVWFSFLYSVIITICAYKSTSIETVLVVTVSLILVLLGLSTWQNSKLDKLAALSENKNLQEES